MTIALRYGNNTGLLQKNQRRLFLFVQSCTEPFWGGSFAGGIEKSASGTAGQYGFTTPALGR